MTKNDSTQKGTSDEKQQYPVTKNDSGTSDENQHSTKDTIKTTINKPSEKVLFLNSLKDIKESIKRKIPKENYSQLSVLLLFIIESI